VGIGAYTARASAQKPKKHPKVNARRSLINGWLEKLATSCHIANHWQDQFFG